MQFVEISDTINNTESYIVEPTINLRTADVDSPEIKNKFY
jgi:hypothetical protein